MRGLWIMVKNPLIQFNDDLVLTYSELQDKSVRVFLEKPNKDRTDFNSAEFDFPARQYSRVIGFTEAELIDMLDRVEKAGELALEWEAMKCYA